MLTKFCTQNGSPKKFWPCTNKFLSSQAFQPCMTLWVQNWPKCQHANFHVLFVPTLTSWGDEKYSSDISYFLLFFLFPIQVRQLNQNQNHTKVCIIFSRKVFPSWGNFQVQPKHNQTCQAAGNWSEVVNISYRVLQPLYLLLLTYDVYVCSKTKTIVVNMIA